MASLRLERPRLSVGKTVHFHVRRFNCQARKIRRSRLSGAGRPRRRKLGVTINETTVDHADPGKKAERSPLLARDLAGPAKGAAKRFHSLVTKVTFRRERLALHISITGFRSALGVDRPAAAWPDNDVGPTESFVVTAPLLYRRRGVQAKLVVDGGKLEPPTDRSLQQAVANGSAKNLGSGAGAVVGGIVLDRLAMWAIGPAAGLFALAALLLVLAMQFSRRRSAESAEVTEPNR